ncbi:MAG: hypothetical protein KJN61_04695, partial [Gammaproteobacteria bacterium]|nr:hypothetical protein [Gammaproteobacteria bacterium]
YSGAAKVLNFPRLNEKSRQEPFQGSEELDSMHDDAAELEQVWPISVTIPARIHRCCMSRGPHDSFFGQTAPNRDVSNERHE